MNPARGAVLPVDKPEGPTSHDVVGRARRALSERRIGHTGTLDPFASGLLLLCVGRATRIAELLTGMEKSYEATARLGVATDTEDRDGAPISTSYAWVDVTPEMIERALEPLRGAILQVPPRYSAKKIDGEAAHRRMRRGEDVSLAAAPVTIHELTATAFDPPDVRFRVRCSTGTYVRSLARDLGAALGVGAHLTSLRRTGVGRFSVADALPLEALDDPARVGAAWISPLDALAHLPRLELGEAEVGNLRHGRSVQAGELPEGGPALAAWNGGLAALGAVRDGRFRPRKVFLDV